MRYTKQADALKKKTETVLAGARDIMDEARKALAAAEEKQAAAEEKITAAIIAGDSEAHKAAKYEADTAKDEVLFFKGVLEQKEKSPLVSEEDYNKAISAVIKEQATAYKEDRARVLELVKELRAIAEEEYKRIEYVNEIIYTWQTEVYKNADRVSNVIYVNDRRITSRPVYDLLCWIDRGNQYKNIEMKENYNPDKLTW